MSTAWLMAGKRTPIGRYLGDLSCFTAPQLAGFSIDATVTASGLPPEAIGEALVGQVLSAGVGQAPARQAMHAAGLPDSIGCTTINKVCGSGLYAAMLAARTIQSGMHDAVLAAGMESMSHAPHILRQGRTGWKMGSQILLDTIEIDGLRCPRGDSPMGVYAESVAREYGISRGDQDHWAYTSHARAIQTQQRGGFDAEIVPISLSETQSVCRDSGPREDTSLEKLGKLKPVFQSHGTVTAGNASSLSDGAASVLVVSDALRRQQPAQTAFRVVAMSVMSQRPQDLFIAPVGAIRKLWQQTSVNAADVDLYEINEAFASQTLACIRVLEIDPAVVNVRGGAIALGHPIGCSGTRVLVTLMHALEQQQLRRGIAALCLGGGEAVAMLIERDGNSQ
jgi:acetyl-CoA C-acetyltransferase